MARNYNPEIVGQIGTFLDDNDWKYSFDDKNGLFRFSVNTRGNIKNVQMAVDINEDCYNVYAISPLSADRDVPEQMGEMAEFVCRANYGLRAGNFELDFNDGELRFKYFVNCDGITPSQEIIRDSIHCPAAMFSRYGGGVLQILFSGMSAADAVAQCEGRLYGEPPADAPDETESAPDTSRLLETLRGLLNGDGAGDEVPAETEI